jgi:hypothetical protein
MTSYFYNYLAVLNKNFYNYLAVLNKIRIFAPSNIG